MLLPNSCRKPNCFWMRDPVSKPKISLKKPEGIQRSFLGPSFWAAHFEATFRHPGGFGVKHGSTWRVIPVTI